MQIILKLRKCQQTAHFCLILAFKHFFHVLNFPSISQFDPLDPKHLKTPNIFFW